MFADSLKTYVSEEGLAAIEAYVEKVGRDPSPATLSRVFSGMPRVLDADEKHRLIDIAGERHTGRGLPILTNGWSVIRLARVWTLYAIPEMDGEAYVGLISNLFRHADMDELEALYSALPLYRYPERWQTRCSEGIRSNIDTVRQAVMLRNHYPSHYLDEGAWNQLVLKAFFTQEPIRDIIGIEDRNNKRLADALVDYAYERYAAGREINPVLWELVGPFADKRATDLMNKIGK